MVNMRQMIGWMRLSSVVVVLMTASLSRQHQLNDNHHSDELNKSTSSQHMSDNKKPPNTATTITCPTAAISSSIGYLFGQPNNGQPSSSEADGVDSLLADVLALVGPDMRPTGGFKDAPDITLDVSQRAWRLMQQHAQHSADQRYLLLWPAVEQLLIESGVSSKCLAAARLTGQSARRLDAWAIQLLNSWGQFPPAGLFEGTLGDIGSFHGCINVPENELIRHAHYCSISYRPVMAHRGDYELLIKREPDQLLRLFSNQSTFHQLANKAQYNHYVYYKLGTCFPIDCSPVDVQRLARLLGRRSILMSGPVKCISKYSDDYEDQTAQAINPNKRQKLILSSKDLNNGIYIWKPHMTRTQLVALIVIGLVVFIIVALSCIHLALDVSNVLSTEETHPPIENNSEDDDSRLDAKRPQTTAIGKILAENYQLEEIKLQNGTKTNPNGGHYPLNENSSLPSSSSSPSNSNNQNLLKHNQRSSSTSLFRELVNDCSIITNTREFFLIGISQHKNDILCINGLRCITMSWIIVAHTMQYNDWSAFARIYEIETHVKSLISQPLFNASYLVDTFFLISGLLTSFSAFRTINLDTVSVDDENHDDDDDHHNDANNNHLSINEQHETMNKVQGNEKQKTRQKRHRTIREVLAKFSCKSYLIGRYLRLTPQILLVSLLFIILPLLSRTGGPHWYTMTGEYSENCSKNWWINLLHIQAFYKSNEMCNFVCWWISVDMFYHLFALLAILTIFKYGHKMSLRLCSLLMLSTGLWQAHRHYSMKLPPNLLSTIPQTGAMWTEMTLKYFWCPEAHTFPFIFGFYVGYLMAQRKSCLKNWFNLRRALVGWLVTIGSLICVSYGTYFWVIGKYTYTNEMATLFNIITQIIWSLCLSWVIVACQLGYGGFINSILSCKLFIILGKASYIVYLSHFLLLFSFFGSQNLLLEPTQVLMLYVIIGNVCVSMVFGSFLCIFFEMPWLKIQKRIMRHI